MFNGAEAAAALDQYRLLPSLCRAEIRRRGFPLAEAHMTGVGFTPSGSVVAEDLPPA
jgi:hypothetical protein